MFPLELHGEVNHEETSVILSWRYFVVKVALQSTRVTDGQTDGRSRYSMLSRANNS